MKKSLFALLAVAFMSFALNSNAQCFERKNSIVTLNAGYGIYSDLMTTKNLTPNYSKSGGTVASVFGANYEYGLLNWLGVGLGFRYEHYIDSATQKQTVFSLDVPVSVNAHFVRTNHWDLSAGINFGYSFIKFIANDSYSDEAHGGGTFFDFHFVPRVFLGNHIGISLPIAYTHLNYPSVTFSNSNTSQSNWESWRFSGLNIGIGLSYKL